MECLSSFLEYLKTDNCPESVKEKYSEIIIRDKQKNNMLAWGRWSNDIHEKDEQKRKIVRAQSISQTKIRASGDKYIVLGSSGEEYTTTLSSCTCSSFKPRNVPCKHMYRIAMMLGLINYKVKSENQIKKDEENAIKACIKEKECEKTANLKYKNNLAEYRINQEKLRIILLDIDKFSMNVPEDNKDEHIDYWKLSDRLEDKCTKYDDKKEKILEKVFGQKNPDDVANNLIIFLNYLLEFKKYCYSYGKQGKDFYREFCSNDLKEFKKEVIDFYNNDYPYCKIDYEVRKNYKK